MQERLSWKVKMSKTQALKLRRPPGKRASQSIVVKAGIQVFARWRPRQREVQAEGEALCRAVKRHDINREQSHITGVSRRER